MIGPFDCCTTARSGDRPGAAGAACTVVSAGSFVEHPVSTAPMEATRTVFPQSLRVITDGASLFDTGPHVPQLVVWQSPHVLPKLPITLSKLCIETSPLKKPRFEGTHRRCLVQR